MIIGLTGSIAMGKSEVARIIRTLNIPVFDADATVHQIYEDGTAAKALSAISPEAIEGKTVNRKILSAHIAKNPELLKSITNIIHPIVNAAEQKFRSENEGYLAVIDSPLILENGRARDMDLLIVVSAAPELQRARALARTEMTPEKFDLIISKQMPDDEKRAWADYVIENNGTLGELETTTKALIDHIKEQAVANA